MKLEEGVQSDRSISFYRRGLGEDKYIDKRGWHMNTLDGLMRDLNDSQVRKTNLFQLLLIYSSKLLVIS